MAKYKIPVPGGVILNVDGEELLPGLQTTMPPVRSAEEQRWYLEGKQEPDLKRPLFQMAVAAARYQGGGKYKDDLPRLAEGDFHHGAIARSVMLWVEDTLEPDSGLEFRSLSLQDITALYEAEKLVAGARPPQGEGSDDEVLNFVCIDHARLAAAIFRKLGYSAQEVNVVVGLYQKVKGPKSEKVKERPFWTYQSAAVRVWHSGNWSYIDPFLSTTNVNDTIRATVQSPLALMPGLSGLKSHEEAGELPFRVYVAKGPVESFRLSGSVLEGNSVTGRWRSIREGWYDAKRKQLRGFVTKVYIPGMDGSQGEARDH